jgi:hypothetical protein
MKDKKGNVVNIIKKVRVKENKRTISIGKGDGKREVANGENYILAIFARLDENGNEIAWEGEIVSLLDAVLRHQKGLPPFEKNRPGMKFKFSLQKGNIVTWEKDGVRVNRIVKGISISNSNIEITCADLIDARELKLARQGNRLSPLKAFKVKMQKYTMDIFGNLRRAND